ESRIRYLISKLENIEKLALAHPFVKGFNKIHHCVNDQMVKDVIHGIFDSASINGIKSKNNAELSQNIRNGDTDITTIRVLYTTTFYVGLEIETGTMLQKQLDITCPTQEFINLVKGWNKYDEKSMDINVKYVKSSDLPPE
ncbi:12831_t:CDS:2, partial [Racocetra persica]